MFGVQEQFINTKFKIFFEVIKKYNSYSRLLIVKKGIGLRLVGRVDQINLNFLN